MKHIHVAGARALIQQTALEILRQPFTLLVLISVTGLVALLPFLINHNMGEGQKLVRDSALSLVFISGLLIAAIGASSILSREMARGSAAAILSKPVGRALFFLSKFGGVSLALLIYNLALLPVVLLGSLAAAPAYRVNLSAALPLALLLPLALAGAGAINYRWGRPTCSHAIGLFLLFGSIALGLGGQTDLLGDPIPWSQRIPTDLLQAHFALFLATLICAAISVTLATRLDIISTLSLTSVAFLAGLISEYAFGRYTEAFPAAWIPFAVLPNWQHFWLADSLNLGLPIQSGYLMSLTAYAALYIGGILALGSALFERMDLRV